MLLRRDITLPPRC